MNITWKDFIDSKIAYVDHGEIKVCNNNHKGFVVVIYTSRFGSCSPIISKPFKTEAEAMIQAHMFVENHRHDLFLLRSFKALQNDVVGYKAVILYDSAYDFFTSRVLKVTIPKGTIVHYPDTITVRMGLKLESKYRAQDAIINYVVGSYATAIDDINDGDVLLSAHCCGKVLGPYRNAFDDRYLRLPPDKFIEKVKDLGGVYSECMSIHIPDFSWEDNECGEGFHYFLTYDEARRYSARFNGMISTLNRYVNKKELHYKHLFGKGG